MKLRHLVVSAALLGAACASVPQPQLVAFTDSFLEAEQAGLAAYDQIYPVLLADSGAEGVSFEESLGPATLDSGSCANRYADETSLIARCQAFRAAAKYNSALLALASGASAEATLQKLDGVLSSVSGLASAAGVGIASELLSSAAAGALKAVLTDALKLRDRAALKNKLDQGSPHVKELIANLRTDADRVYGIARGSWEVKLTESLNGIGEKLDPAFAIVSARSAPTGADDLARFDRARESIDAVLQREEFRFRTKSISEQMSPGGTPLSSTQVASLVFASVELDAATKDFSSVAATFQPVREGLTEYAALLADLETSFNELVAASNDPFSQGGAIAQLTAAVSGVRDHARAVKAAFN